MKVLVVNCGSSSIKFRLYRMPENEVLVRGLLERIGEPETTLNLQLDDSAIEMSLDVTGHEDGIATILEILVNEIGVIHSLDEIEAVGHRVVHGGDRIRESVLITDEIIDIIEQYARLAPLHNPPNLMGIRALEARLPGVPQVAAFDTAFHTSLPPVAFLYALPYELYEQQGIRRYGFHGTSHRYVARRAAQMMGLHKYSINCITCHLGNGSSIAAVRNGHSVDTSMGLTPLEGLVMGTRTGDLDPAAMLYLIELGYDGQMLNDVCNRQSGLLGISGCSNDMRTLVELAEIGHVRARLALDLFAYRLKKYIGSYTAILGRVDALVFTGGIGENAISVRADVCTGLEHLGIVLDQDANLRLTGEGDISKPGTPVHIFVIPTDEEGAIASDTYQLARNLQGVTGA